MRLPEIYSHDTKKYLGFVLNHSDGILSILVVIPPNEHDDRLRHPPGHPGHNDGGDFEEVAEEVWPAILQRQWQEGPRQRQGQ